ncbi:uncharacterized [Tachysurus ichikawai]
MKLCDSEDKMIKATLKVSRVARRANWLSAIMLYSLSPPLSLSRRLSEEEVQHKWSKCGVTVIAFGDCHVCQLFVPFSVQRSEIKANDMQQI